MWVNLNMKKDNRTLQIANSVIASETNKQTRKPFNFNFQCIKFIYFSAVRRNALDAECLLSSVEEIKNRMKN